MTIQFWRLSEATDDNLGLACTGDGLLLGRTPIVARRGEHFVVREQREIERLFRRAYHDATAVERIMSGLGTVAAALNADDRCLACIAAVHLRIPDLPDYSARDRMEAEDALIKYARGEAPDPDWDPAKHPRTGTPPNPGWFAPTDGEGSESSPVRTAENDDPNRRTDVPPVPHDDWVRLPPGQYIDELHDFLEWLGNAKPEDEQAIRAEIKRYYYDVGDTLGGDTLNRVLGEILEAGSNTAVRQQLLDSIVEYAQTDPAEMGLIHGLLPGAILAFPPIAAQSAQVVPRVAEEETAGSSAAEAPAAAATSQINPWSLGWGARGDYISEALGANLPRNFPVIDAWGDGIATSIKSIDLNAATYQDATRLTYRLNGYVDQMALYAGGKMGSVEIESTAITGRELSVAIPAGSMTTTQRAVFEAARLRAEAFGVKLVVTEF